jgi:class 3 adenylate cyclase
MTAMQQPIRFATTRDHVRIAYTVIGDEDGPPIVCPPGWVSHVELEWQTASGEFMQRLARGRRLLIYDGRGTGLSDRHVDDFSLQARLNDLEAVIEHAGLEQFTLFAWSQGSPTAMAYAAQHPERVANLILYASFCRGPEDQERAVIQAVTDLIRLEWGAGARTTMGFIHPDAEREEMEESLRYFRAASTGEVAARILQEGFLNTDVREYLPRITAPALVLHRKDDNAIRLEFGREVATLLPNARFVVLEGDHHPPFYGDSEAVLRAIDEFLGVEPAPPAHGQPAHTHAGAPVTILFTDMEGSTSLTQRLGDAEAQKMVRAHNAVVRDALRSHGGDEIKHTGDGIMASFHSASSALECAIAIQRALALHNQDHPDTTINLRIGLNMGEPVREQDDLFGQAVQLARRICDRAAPGQILTSNVVRELVAGKGFLFSDQGETELRGFEDPVRLYEVRWTE